MEVSAAFGAAHAVRRRVPDVAFVGLSWVHAGAIVLVPSIPLVTLGLWWSANTVAHNFIHRPFFRARWMNHAYSAYLSVVLGLPQRLWRDRHLAHHGGRPARVRWSAQLVVETTLVVALWAAMAAMAPRFLLTVYMPGWILGLALCQLQGHYEHARGTTSHYGRLYNLLFFNDGYHVEHHARPHAHWQTLADAAPADARPSRWPPVLRWLETFEPRPLRSLSPARAILEGLERLVLQSPALQRYVVSLHERAFRRVLDHRPGISRATIVGGGLFPRTAIVLRRVLPAAALTVVDESHSHLALAAPRLTGDDVRFVHARFDPACGCDDTDLLVVPLAFDGARRRLYERPPAPLVLVHDWIWNRRGRSVVISWLLLKRLNLIAR